MGEKGVGKLSRETPPPREGEPMGATRIEIGLLTSYRASSSAASLHKQLGADLQHTGQPRWHSG